MVKHKANAKFLIDLAQKDRSLAPHIPKRYSDMVGLFWAVRGELAAPDRQAALFRKRTICEPAEWGCSLNVDPSGLLIAGFFPGSIFDGCNGFTMTHIGLPGRRLSPIARWRLYTCFLSIAEDLGIAEQWSKRIAGE